MRIGPAADRGAAVTIWIDGQPTEAYAGETVAAALLASGKRVFRLTDKSRAPRGLYCGMGVCFDCLVTVDGEALVRACVTPVRAGMMIETGATPRGARDCAGCGR
jgi:NADH dehydrogenase/NADH:ubiquinone oxidoreductase subunit G